jgi:release factor glutamine methyltransferase
MDKHPDKLFILLTPPPLNPAATNPTDAERARVFAEWMKSSEYFEGHPNIYTFDFFDLLAEGDPKASDFNMLKQAYRDGDDSHPNRLANETIGPLFVEFIIDAVGIIKMDLPHPVINETLPAGRLLPITEQEILFDSLYNKLAASWKGLPDLPEENPESVLCALWYLAAGFPRAVEYCCKDSLPQLTSKTRKVLISLVDEQLSGALLAHQTGRQCFMGIEFLTGPQALVPRKETEILGRAALTKLNQIVGERGSALVIDLCTGCGNLALALALNQPLARVYGSDLCPEAVCLAEMNAHHLGLDGQVTFLQGDLFAPFESGEFLNQVDLIVCNPPYISSRQVDLRVDEISPCEPRLAFDGGTFGVSILLRLVKEAPKFLKPGGWLCFEVGAGQAEGIRAKLNNFGVYCDLEIFFDRQENGRALAVNKK